MDRYVGLELDDPAIDFVGLAHAFGIAAKHANTVADATDLIQEGLKSNSAILIDVELSREFRPS